MSLDMYGTVDAHFSSVTVTLIRDTVGAYNGPGGTWQDGPATETTLHNVSITAAPGKEVEAMKGGAFEPSDFRRVIVNDGTMMQVEERPVTADVLEFDGQRWRVMKTDNRPWRNYSRAIVERYRE